MKKLLFATALFFSVTVSAQIFYPYTSFHMSPYYMDITIINESPARLSCQGWFTVFNFDTRRTSQFFFKAAILPGAVSYTHFYLGPFHPGFSSRVMTNNIRCWMF